METVPADWSIRQLTEFSSFVSGFVEQAAAARAAIERASEALDAEVGALVFDDRIGPVVGFAAGQVPAGDLLDAARGTSRRSALSAWRSAASGPCSTFPAWATAG